MNCKFSKFPFYGGAALLNTYKWWNILVLGVEDYFGREFEWKEWKGWKRDCYLLWYYASMLQNIYLPPCASNIVCYKLITSKE